MSHTPGPWQMDEVRTDSGRAFRIGSGEMLTAGKGCCIIYDDHGSRENQRKANARLIAAAPDMLYAIEQLIDGAAYDGKIQTHDHTLRMLLNVYEKATGNRPPI